MHSGLGLTGRGEIHEVVAGDGGDDDDDVGDVVLVL